MNVSGWRQQDKNTWTTWSSGMWYIYLVPGHASGGLGDYLVLGPKGRWLTNASGGCGFATLEDAQAAQYMEVTK